MWFTNNSSFETVIPNILSLQQRETIWMSRLLNPFNNLPQKIYWIMASYKKNVWGIRPLLHVKNKLEMTKCRFCKEKHSLWDICLEVYIEVCAVLCPGQHDAVSYISAFNPTHHFRIDHYIWIAL